MEAVIIRIFKGLVFTGLLYLGLIWLGIPHAKALMISMIPLIASLVNLLTHSAYLISFLVLLLGFANIVFEGVVTRAANEVVTLALNSFSQKPQNDVKVHAGPRQSDSVTEGPADGKAVKDGSK